jgi:hypothetical protein
VVTRAADGIRDDLNLSVFRLCGSRDYTGSKGDTGPAGVKGDTGDPGPAGVKGGPGVAGPKGDTGDPGPAGVKVDTGSPGPAGAKGDPGAASTVPGPAGPQGIPGPHGEQGVSGSTPTCGTLVNRPSWTGQLFSTNHGPSMYPAQETKVQISVRNHLSQEFHNVYNLGPTRTGSCMFIVKRCGPLVYALSPSL